MTTCEVNGKKYILLVDEDHDANDDCRACAHATSDDSFLCTQLGGECTNGGYWKEQE
jgi:hypothetical protein